MRYCTLITLFLAALGPAALAQDEKAHEEWMKTSNQNNRAMKKAIAANSKADATTAANTIADVYVNVEKFWAARKTDDAVGWSKEATAAAKEVATALTAGSDPASAVQKLDATCKSCHSKYRERLPDGSYRIKQ